MKKIIATILLLVLVQGQVFAAFPTDYRKQNPWAQKVDKVPSERQIRLDYDGRSDDNPVYVGYATAGTASSDSDWMILKFTYDGSDRVTLVQIAYGAWDSRTGLTYS